MALNDLLAALENGESVTPVTPRNPEQVTAKPAPNKACTLVTPVTPQIINAKDEERIARWLLSFIDADELTVLFVPPVTHTEATAYYPDAVAAEPIPDRPQRKPTKAEAEEITALVRAIYANDTDDDRAEALAAALADPDGGLLCYRTIASDRGIAIAAPIVGTVKACRCCQYFARPGKSEGYCSVRDDLPLAYGVNHPLRRLPADGGASCKQWKAEK